MATILNYLGQPAESAVMLERVIRIHRDALKSPDLAEEDKRMRQHQLEKYLSLLGTALLQMGETERAAEVKRDHSELLEKLYPTNHLERQLAEVRELYKPGKDLQPFLEKGSEFLELLKKVHGPAGFETLQLSTKLAHAYSSQGRPDIAWGYVSEVASAITEERLEDPNDRYSTFWRQVYAAYAHRFGLTSAWEFRFDEALRFFPGNSKLPEEYHGFRFLLLHAMVLAYRNDLEAYRELRRHALRVLKVSPHLEQNGRLALICLLFPESDDTDSGPRERGFALAESCVTQPASELHEDFAHSGRWPPSGRATSRIAKSGWLDHWRRRRKTISGRFVSL